MYYQVAFVPGGQALGVLERLFAKLGKRVKKLFGANRRKALRISDAEDEGSLGAV